MRYLVEVATMRTLQIALAIPVILLAGAPAVATAATIKTVALQNDESPEPAFFYKKFDPPTISDAAAERVAVYSTLAGKRCIFTLDPDTATGSTVVCKGDPTPDLHAFAKFGARLGN